MEKENNFSVRILLSSNFVFVFTNLFISPMYLHMLLSYQYTEPELFILQPPLPGFPDYSFDHHQQLRRMNSQIDEGSSMDNNAGVANFTMNVNTLQQQQHQPQPQQQQMSSPGFYMNNSLDRLSFAEVMQFADFGPKLAPSQARTPEEETGLGLDSSGYFLKFPVLNDKSEDQALICPSNNKQNIESSQREVGTEGGEDTLGVSENATSSQLRFLREDLPKSPTNPDQGKNKRKRPRSIKTSEEVESQRMTHIAVERNRRKQMNEHLRVLRALMPSSYVQRGDQASIIGGAIEFVRELEQLLQCLESQKRRRLYGGSGEPQQQMGESSSSLAMVQMQPATGAPPPPPFFPPLESLPSEEAAGNLALDFEASAGGFQEETAESKSCLADVEVKVLGFDAMIKILSRRRPGQLIQTIAALEDLQLNIVHTNITTIEQTVLYSFNVKVESESRFTAEDIASSVQQIFSFIHANCGI